jgi:glycosyltransferase involved in cell wall biosynthesis|tara:strand:- start:43 stop:1188 length:1146 start_codon:yes stop_codon:yes gene_type:complete
LIKKKIYYWSPSLVNIATNKAVINSAYSINKYDQQYSTRIINFFGEFSRFKRELDDKKIETIELLKLNLIQFLPKYGKISSRFSFILIFIFSFLPLKNLIKKNQPDYLIIHLITSLPLLLLILFKFKTKFILRISGLPKMNFFRKLLWKIALQKIYKVTCPTKSTLLYLKSLKIVDEDKISVLYDPIINISEINKKKKENINIKYDYVLAVGRLTRQKNFFFLCKAIANKLKTNEKIKLLIAGEGEDKNNINQFIKDNNLEDKIILLGHIKNIFPYFLKAKAFILTSLWEDPGFVLVEAAISRTLVLSTSAKPGPNELIKNNLNGIVYQENDYSDFKKQFDKIFSLENSNILKINNLKSVKKFTLLRHYSQIKKTILRENL